MFNLGQAFNDPGWPSWRLGIEPNWDPSFTHRHLLRVGLPSQCSESYPTAAIQRFAVGGWGKCSVLPNSNLHSSSQTLEMQKIYLTPTHPSMQVFISVAFPFSVVLLKQCCGLLPSCSPFVLPPFSPSQFLSFLPSLSSPPPSYQPRPPCWWCLNPDAWLLALFRKRPTSAGKSTSNSG